METTKNQRVKSVVSYTGMSVNSFSKKIGISQATLASMFNRGTEPKDAILDSIANAIPEINKIWLFTGKGEMLNSNKQDFTRQNATNEAGKNDFSDYETWLLPQTAHGGSLTNIPADATLLQNCEKIISPIKGVDFAISIYGDSMAPEYPSGSRVLIKKINPDIFIEWGKTYVMDTSNGVVIKEVIPSSREGYIKCHSINPDPKYVDFEVPMQEIYGMYRVLMCLSAK